MTAMSAFLTVNVIMQISTAVIMMLTNISVWILQTGDQKNFYSSAAVFFGVVLSIFASVISSESNFGGTADDSASTKRQISRLEHSVNELSRDISECHRDNYLKPCSGKQEQKERLENKISELSDSRKINPVAVAEGVVPWVDGKTTLLALSWSKAIALALFVAALGSSYRNLTSAEQSGTRRNKGGTSKPKLTIVRKGGLPSDQQWNKINPAVKKLKSKDREITVRGVREMAPDLKISNEKLLNGLRKIKG